MSTRKESTDQVPRTAGRLGLPTSGARLLSFLGLLVASLGLAPLALTASAQVAPHATTSGGTFVAVTPFRLLDTRSSTGGQPFGVSSTDTLQITGAGSGAIPTSGVTAVVGNLTALKATSAGYFQAFPASGGLPSVSNLNFAANQTVPNLVTVPVSASGQISIHDYLYNQSASGSVQGLFDVYGYYTTNTSGTTGLFNPITPIRIADTRTGSGQPDAGTPLGSKSTTQLTVTGSASGVPTTASAVVLNVTVAAPTASGYLTVWPAGASQPTASNLNFTAGHVFANRVIVGVGTSGQVSIFNSFGTTQLIVDVDGYYTGSSGGTGSAYFPITPTRIVDTRSSFGGTTIGGGSSESFTIAGAGGVPSTGATAVVSNVTALGTTSTGYLTIYPSTATKPVASDLNWPGANATVANMTQVGLGTAGAITIFNGGAGSSNILVDLFGYFGASNVTGVGVSASPASLPVNATGFTTSRSTITATVTSSGTLVSGDTVLFTLSGSACGTFTGGLSSITGTTSANGLATTTYIAGTSTGTCTITATSAKLGTSGTATVTQTVIANQVNFASPVLTTGNAAGAYNTVVSGTPLYVTVTVTNPSAAVVAGDSVTFSATGTPAAACPTISSTAVTTNSAGQAAVSYTPTSTAGFCVITATESATGGSNTLTIDQKVSLTTIAAVAVTTSPSILSANGSTTSTVTVTVTGSGFSAANDGVMLSTTGLECGTLGSTALVTNASSVATTTYTAGADAGTCQITAQEADGGFSSPAGVNSVLSANLAANATTLSITNTVPDPAPATAFPVGAVVDVVNGTASAQYTVTVAGAGTNPVTMTVAANTNPAVLAIGSQVTVDGSSVINQTGAVTPSNTFTVAPTGVPAVVLNAQQSFTVTVTSPTGGPVTNDTITAGSVVGVAPYLTSSCGTVAPSSANTGSGNTATFVYTGDGTAPTNGFCTFTLSDASGASATIYVNQQS